MQYRETNIFSEYIEKQKKEVNYLKTVAEKLQILNKEVKEENDKWEARK